MSFSTFALSQQPPKPIDKLTTMPTKPPPPFSGLKTAPSTTVGYALDHHFKQLFQSPSRKFLELAALREHLPSVSTDDAGSDTSATNKSTSTAAATSSSRHVLCVVVHSAGAQHLGRKDNPFFEGNFVRRVEAAAVRYVEEDSAKSPFEFMQRRTARTMFSTSKTYTPEVLENHWRQRDSVCGDKAVFLTPAQVVVMADPKRGLTLLRKDPLFLEMFFRPPPPPPAGAPQQSDSSSSSSSSSSLLPRIWCVLYAQFILSGFRVKYETVAEVAKVYPPMPLTTNSTTPPSDTDLLAYLYEQQVAAGATGRVLLSIRERMEGLLASTVMEVNGVAVADTETVDNVLREIQTEKASVDLVLSEHAGKWFVDTARTNFNWQSQSDVAAVLYGGGLLKLMKGQRSAPTTTAQPLSSNAIGTAIKKPLLHRYLLESFGVDRGAVTVAQAGGIFSPNGDIQSLPPYEMYRTDNLTPSERIAALTFITQRTTVVAISLRMIGDRIAFASLFIPAGPECGGGQLIAARIIGDDGRPLATAAASTKQDTCVLHAAFKQGIVPDVKSNEKVTALMSLVEFRDAIRNNALLKTLRNLSCAATLDTTSAEVTAEEDEEAPDENDDGNDGAKAKPPTRSLMNRRKIQRENSTLDGHALERIASLPPNVVFVYSNDEAQKQVVHSIESCIVQAVCDALEIVDDERVSFVPAQAMAVQIEATNNSSLNGGGVSAGAAASVPNFAQDFEELEKSSSGESANAAAVWLQQVLGVHETVPMSKANIYPGVFGGQPSTTTQVGAAHSISYSVLMQRALESLHKQMVERWISTKAASSHPYINLDTQLSTSLPRKWLRNHSAMMHPQQLLYREGYLWESIRTSFSGPRHAKKRAELCDEVVAITTRFGTSDVQRDSGAVTSVNSSVLERLSELWKNNGMDDALLAALVQHRSTAKVIQLFAPERLLRCGMKAEATAKVNTIHAHIAHQNTNTGRLASQTPCIHNLPKNVMVRNLFTSRFGADSGMLIEADYSQLEVVTLALLAGDTQMIKELRDSVDFHCLRVSLITKEPYADVVRKAKKEKDPRYVSLRQQAKVFSFQRQYGAGSAALSSTTGMSIAEIEALIAAEDAHYPQLTEYYRHVGVSAGMSAASIIQSYRPDMMMKRVGGSPFADARLTNLRTAVEPPKYYPVVTGTKFDFSLKSDIPTLKNHPVQGFAGELVQIACGRLSRHLTSSPLLRCPTTGLHRAFLTNSVHDCVWIDCHRDVADVVEKLVKEDMESICTTLTTTFWRGDESLLANYLSEDERAELLKQQQLSGGAPWWQPDLPFPVTVHRGKNLGELLD
ncbi:mitochondrial DNA polymerase I protein fragment, putative [Bodo saltans]|uniref:DNA-directed DNA polymerase n=1 Tax=Bodo saltans TaxID=75058 RepID=A0A0S4J2J4_BODSA|nr:mitochondrial DNA polymerase I protein fragment, putative [Bodo saltans]